MSQKEAIRAFEDLLTEIGSYRTPFTEAVEGFVSAYGIDFEASGSPRPAINGTSTSSVIREVREG